MSMSLHMSMLNSISLCIYLYARIKMRFNFSLEWESHVKYLGISSMANYHSTCILQMHVVD